MAAATVFAAGSGYLVTVVAARALGSTRYEVFAVFWALFFAIAGILGGLVQETTRAIRTGAELPTEWHPRLAPTPFLVSVVLGAVFTGGLIITSPLWVDRIISEHPDPALWLLAGSTLSLAPQAALSGILSGAGLWRAYAGMLGLDAAARLIAAAVVAAGGGGTIAFFLVAIAGSLSWLVTLAVSRDARRATRLRADVPLAQFLRRTLQAMAAATAAAILIVGFPVLLSATTPDEERAALGPVILAVTLTRAPFLVPLTSFQSAVIVYFVEQQRSTSAALRRPVLLLGAAAMAITAAAAVLGPPLVRLFFGADFTLSGATLGALTFGAACTAWLMVSGCAALARARHTLFSGGWLLAGAVSFALLALLPAGLSTRTALALVVGPLVGSVLHLLALRGPHLAHRPSVPR
ncbi:hypothetical protein [Geodermatophilus sp. SYSU D00698]